MKIAVLSPYIEGIGGAQRVIAEYSTFLKEKGHEIEIWTQRYDPEKSYPQFKNIKINQFSLKNKFFSPWIFLFKKFKGFDLVIANDWPTNFSSIRNKKTLWVCYSPKRDFYDLKEYYWNLASFKGKISLLIKRLLFRRVDQLAAKKTILISAISKNVQDRVKKYYSKDSEIVYCGTDFNRYKNLGQENYFLCVSRLVKPKRVDLVIKSMALVKNKTTLYIVGSGPEEKDISDLCAKYPNIKFIGEVNEQTLLELYGKCLGVIYTPINEDWGLIPIESAACEKPFIGANEGGLKEIVLDGKTGFLVEPTPENIAEKIDFLTKNKKKAELMGKAGKKYCKQFDWKVLIPKLENLIGKVVYSQKV